MLNGDLKIELQISGIKISKKFQSKLLLNYNVPHLYYNKVFFYCIGRCDLIFPVYTYVNNNSDFELCIDNNEKIFIKGNDQIFDVIIFNKPSYYDKLYKEKKGYEIGSIEANGHLAITINHFCIHFYRNEECQFCSIQSWSDNNKNTQNELIEVIKAANSENLIKHISLTTGTTNDTDKGILGMINFIEKLNNIGINVPIACEFEPVEDLEWINLLYEHNVSTISCNIEILEEKIRKKIMPGKGNIPRSLYFKNWEKCVELFGENQVYTNILLNKFDSNITEIEENLKQICEIGVIPSIGLVYPEENTKMSKCIMPEINFVKRIQKTNIMQMVNNNLNPLLALAGNPRNGSYSPIKEYYFDFKTFPHIILPLYKATL